MATTDIRKVEAVTQLSVFNNKSCYCLKMLKFLEPRSDKLIVVNGGLRGFA